MFVRQDISVKDDFSQEARKIFVRKDILVKKDVCQEGCIRQEVCLLRATLKIKEDCSSDRMVNPRDCLSM
jgi:hypothetical protein